MTRVSVVIPNWNGLEHLGECFAALDAQRFRDFEVVFVDNASADGSVEWVRANASDARIVGRDHNGGFAKAVNAGIAVSDAEYVALLNNDTHVEPGWLEALVGALDRGRCYDSAASLMVFHHDPAIVNAAGDTYSLLRVSGRNRGLGSPVARFGERCRVLGACAGAALYRRSVFADVGLFDEDFFLLHEDTDWNLRALIAGKRCVYVPEAVVRHKNHGSLDRQPARAIQILEWRNKALVAAKTLPGWVAPVAAVGWALTRAWWTVRGPVGKRMAMAADIRVAVREARRDGRGKRAAVYATRRVSTLTILRWLARGTGRYEECSTS
jgi:GT2 family glycosyltransferase